jgi:DNA-binding response OmpR family regulator
MKVLLVQDNKRTVKFLHDNLVEQGYDVEVAFDGEEGLRHILSDKYDLIILEALLPKIDGLTLIKELRAKSNHTPILILSQKDSVDDIVAGLDAGADDYLTKPFTFSELLARVQALQRRTEQERGAKIYFADMCLDPVTHKVWRNNNEIEITPKEYDLLEYMMRNPNQILTRNMIADAVWEGQFDKFTNIIDVYVNYLRKRIDRGVEKKLIHTVRGAGYTFAIKE